MHVVDLRSVYARAADGSIFFLPENGSTAEVKELAKTGFYRCIDPHCEHPTLSAHAGDLKRHHFQHTETVDHVTNAETLLHIIGRQVIADWIKAQHPQWPLTQELERDGDRFDIGATSPERLIHIEIQQTLNDVLPAGLGTDIDAWFWIEQVSSRSAHPGTPTQQVLWLDPIEATIGVPWISYLGQTCSPGPGRVGYRQVSTEALSQASIGPDGTISSPMLDKVRAGDAQVQVLEQERAEQMEREAERRRQAAAEYERAEQERRAAQAESEERRRKLRAEQAVALARPSTFYTPTIPETLRPPVPAMAYSAERVAAEIARCEKYLDLTTGPERAAIGRFRDKWAAVQLKVEDHQESSV